MGATQLCICACVCLRECAYLRVYVYVCVCMFMCVHIVFFMSVTTLTDLTKYVFRRLEMLANFICLTCMRYAYLSED